MAPHALTNGRFEAPTRISVVESSIPPNVTIAEYKRTRVLNPRPWWRRKMGL